MLVATKYKICIGTGTVVQIVALCTVTPLKPLCSALLIPYLGFATISAPVAIAIITSLVGTFQCAIYGWILAGAWARHQLLRYSIVLALFHLVTAAFAYHLSDASSYDVRFHHI
jgi:hypothetical protein